MDIVLGYDDSDCAKAALDVAVAVAGAFGDRIVVVYAYAPPERVVGVEYREHEHALHELGEQAKRTRRHASAMPMSSSRSSWFPKSPRGLCSPLPRRGPHA